MAILTEGYKRLTTKFLLRGLVDIPILRDAISGQKHDFQLEARSPQAHVPLSSPSTASRPSILFLPEPVLCDHFSLEARRARYLQPDGFRGLADSPRAAEARLQIRDRPIQIKP